MFLMLYGPFESIRSVEPLLWKVVDSRDDRELLGSTDPWIRWCGLRPTLLFTSLLAPLMLHDPVCSVESGWTGPHARVLRSRQCPLCVSRLRGSRPKSGGEGVVVNFPWQ